MSQERGAMSTSWSGNPASASLHYQAQLDAEQKLLLGSSQAMPNSYCSSLAMPPLSNTNTIRKTAARPVGSD